MAKRKEERQEGKEKEEGKERGAKMRQRMLKQQGRSQEEEKVICRRKSDVDDEWQQKQKCKT